MERAKLTNENFRCLVLFDPHNNRDRHNWVNVAAGEFKQSKVALVSCLAVRKFREGVSKKPYLRGLRVDPSYTTVFIPHMVGGCAATTLTETLLYLPPSHLHTLTINLPSQKSLGKVDVTSWTQAYKNLWEKNSDSRNGQRGRIMLTAKGCGHCELCKHSDACSAPVLVREFGKGGEY